MSLNKVDIKVVIMDLYSGIAVYFIIWWLVFFLVLPLAISPPNPDNLIPGQDRGAPESPKILKKLFIATAGSGALFLMFYYCIKYDIISLRDT